MSLPSQVNIGTKSHPLFERLTFNDDIAISIQGSRFHYSTPQENRDNLNGFQAVEIAVFKDGKWAIPVKFSELFEDGETAVAGYVPKETAEEMVKLAEAGNLEVRLAG